MIELGESARLSAEYLARTPNQQRNKAISCIAQSIQKNTNKIYYRHTNHPGGIKQTTPERLTKKNKTDDILRMAVKRMLPGGVLAKKQLTKLKIYKGNTHPHETQNPKVINFSKINKKNSVTIN